jgi:hypothetical protein
VQRRRQLKQLQLAHRQRRSFDVGAALLLLLPLLLPSCRR